MPDETLPIAHPFWVETHSGVAFDLMVPRPGMFKIEDVAHHLSRLNRFNGAIDAPGYSVAQHCVHVSELVPTSFVRRALLHDVEEYVLGDMTAPWKRLLAQHTQIVSYYVKVVREAAGKAFGVQLVPTPPEVVRADLYMLVAEARDLLHARRPAPQPWSPLLPSLAEVRFIPTITPWTPDQAKARFLEVFEQTGGAS